jgi:transcription termination factor Rho
MALKDLHLADLHERARELDLPRYRMLTRDQLIEAIEEAGGEGDRAEKPPEEERPRTDGDERPREGRGRGRRPPPEPEEEVETEEVTGVLDRMPQGYGFLRLTGLHSA